MKRVRLKIINTSYTCFVFIRKRQTKYCTETDLYIQAVSSRLIYWTRFPERLRDTSFKKHQAAVQGYTSQTCTYKIFFLFASCSGKKGIMVAI